MPRAVNFSTRLKPQTGVLKHDVSGSMVLFNMEDGQYYALNEIAARIWELCDGTRTVSDVVAVICCEYDAPAPTISEDVVDVLEGLRTDRLVVDADAAV